MIHPYVYWRIVDEMTKKKKDWDLIKTHLGQKTKVASYSTPQIPTRQKVGGLGIKMWLRFAENDLIRDSAPFSHLLITDIANFYPSIYTHSIAWALHGREIFGDVKKRGDYSLLGNRLDKLFQNARQGKTNGIPIGSMVSDLIAECILVKVDSIMSEQLDPNCIAARYRDDYRILCSSYSDAHKIMKRLNRVLHDEFDLSLNPDKTAIYDDIAAYAFRPWTKEIQSNPLFIKLSEYSSEVNFTYKEFRETLIAIYDIQKRYPGGRPANTVLSRLIKVLDDALDYMDIKYDELHFAISMLRQISRLKEDTTPQAMIIIDKLMEKLTNREKDVVIRELTDAFTDDPDTYYQEIWVHRIALHHNPTAIENLFKSSANPVVQALMSPAEDDYKIFNDIGLPVIDNLQLKKFSLIDNVVLGRLENSPIDQRNLNIFGYDTGPNI